MADDERREPQIQHTRKESLRPGTLSLFSFICALVLLGLFLWKADRLVALGLVGNLYFIVLIPLGIFVAASLFGILRSYGSFRGKLLGGVLRLGGPPVAFFLVLFLGMRLVPPASNFPLTVFVHGSKGRQDLILRGTGAVLIDTGGLRRRAAIDAYGQAFFPEIPANLRGQEASVALDASDYELVNHDQRIQLTPDSAYLGVRKKDGRVFGQVHDEAGEPVSQARVSVAGISGLTNADGSFAITIPGEQLQSELRLQVVAVGYTTWSDPVVPNSNEITITLARKK